ncbi:hypothetical protein [Marichromatium purpuratum]|uniref:hypothetical protein n=1 Tax=Marichromatium purpuratum TaxID=37487 RepID=UPI0012EC99E9|nr:hypothetical protein [Marichromatium purpuratum]
MYATKDEFISVVRGTPALELVEAWLDNPLPYAFADTPARDRFFSKIQADWPEISMIQCAGTANWKYSLNPNKDFRQFCQQSDIDVISISQELFESTWDRMRSIHRSRWYELPSGKRRSLRRNGENVYSGFACPKWIPSMKDTLRFKFVTSLDRYSISEVGFRDVNMYFFKSIDEAADYYRRGVENAKRKI